MQTMTSHPEEIESQKALERRRKERLGTIWLGVAVFIAGNVADWQGWINWGPLQHDSAQRPWILASALAFWVAASSLVVFIADCWSMYRNGSRPPTRSDLVADSGLLRKPANWIRERVEKHHALVGAAGLFGGAVLGHFFWKP
jgi:hypothetical protein